MIFCLKFLSQLYILSIKAVYMCLEEAIQSISHIQLPTLTFLVAAAGSVIRWDHITFCVISHVV